MDELNPIGYKRSYVPYNQLSNSWEREVANTFTADMLPELLKFTEAVCY